MLCVRMAAVLAHRQAIDCQFLSQVGQPLSRSVPYRCELAQNQGYFILIISTGCTFCTSNGAD